MKIKIELNCPHCQGTKIKKNGWKSYGKQNYLCKESGGTVFFVWGKRDAKTARKLRKKLLAAGIGYDRICTDNCESFIISFLSDNHIIRKRYAAGIEGNNCRLRHRIRRAFRKTCCFSKIRRNYLKAFNLAFFYINFGYV
jgi:IS1 family transposase